MKELVEALIKLKDVGIALIIVVGLLYIALKLIEKFPLWCKSSEESKERRAKIYATALLRLGDQVENCTKTIIQQGSVIERLLDAQVRHNDHHLEMTKQFVVHGVRLEQLCEGMRRNDDQ